MGRGEVPKKRRDIRTQENRDPVILENPRRDHNRKSREDMCQNPGGSWNSENRSSRARRNLVTRNRDPRIRDKIQTVHLVDTWRRSAPSGKSRQGVNPPVIEVHWKSPDRKVIHRKSRFENLGIGKSGTPVMSEPYTLKPRTPRTRQKRMTVVI
jgi:hypothetical protein